jgi:hypothetical protein
MWMNSYTYNTTKQKTQETQIQKNLQNQEHGSYALQITNFTAEMQMLPVVLDLEGEQ